MMNAGIIQAKKGVINGKILGLATFAAGSTIGARDIVLRAGDLDNNGIIIATQGADIGIDNLFKNIGGSVYLGDSASISADILENRGGKFKFVRNGKFTVRDFANLESGEVRAGEGRLEFNGETFTNAGDSLLRAQTALDLGLTGNAFNAIGSSLSAEKINIHAGRLFENSGLIETIDSVDEDMVIDSGRFINSGDIVGRKNISIKAKESAGNTGSIRSREGDIIYLSRSMVNNGMIQAGDTINVKISELGEFGAESKIRSKKIIFRAGDFVNRGDIVAADRTDVGVDTSLKNTSGIIASIDGDIILSGRELINSGIIQSHGGIYRLGTGQQFRKIENIGTISAGSKIEFKDVDEIINSGKVEALSLLDLQGGRLENKSTGELSASNVTLSIREVINEGNIIATDLVDIGGNILDNNGGAIATKNVSLNIREILNRHDSYILSRGEMTIRTDMLNNIGRIQSEEALNFFITRGRFENSGTVLSGTSVTVLADILENRGGTFKFARNGKFKVMDFSNLDNAHIISKHEGLEFEGQKFANEGGSVIRAPEWLDLKFADSISNGTGSTLFTENGLLSIDTLRLANSGHIISSKSMSLKASDDLVNDGGIIFATESLGAKAKSIVNAGRAWIESAHLTLDSTAFIHNEDTSTIITTAGDVILAGGELVNSGTIKSAGNIYKLATGQQFNKIENIGTISAGSEIEFKDVAEIINSGKVEAADLIDLSGGNLINVAGGVLDARAITLNFTDITNGLGSLILSSNLIDIDAEIVTNIGSIEASGEQLKFTVSRELINHGIISAKEGGIITNIDGLIRNDGTLSGRKFISLSGARVLDNKGLIVTAGIIEGNVDILVNSGIISSLGLLKIDSTSLDNTGEIKAFNFRTNIADLLENSGLIRVSGGWSGGIGGNLINSGNIYIAGNTYLSENITGDLVNTGIIDFVSRFAGKILGNLENNSSLKFRQGADLIVSGIVDLKAGLLYSAGDSFKLDAQSLYNLGDIQLDSIQSELSLRNASELGAVSSHGNVTIRADEKLSLTGKVISTGDIRLEGLTAADVPELEVNQWLQSGGNIIINAKRDVGKVTINNTILAANQLLLTAGEIVNRGRILAGELVINTGSTEDIGIIGSVISTTLDVAGKLTINHGKAITTSGILAIRANELDIKGATNSGGASIFDIRGGPVAASGIVHAGGDITLTGASSLKTLSGAQIYSNRNLTLGSGSLAVSSGSEIFAGGTLNANIAGSTSNSGVIGAGSALSLSSSSITNGGYIQGKGVTIFTGTLNNNNFLLSSTGDMRLTAYGGGVVTNTGTIETLGSGNIAITAGSFVNLNSGARVSKADSAAVIKARSIVSVHEGKGHFWHNYDAVKLEEKAKLQRKVEEAIHGQTREFYYLDDTYSDGTPAKLVSAGNITFSGAATNSHSLISAAGRIDGGITNISESAYRNGFVYNSWKEFHVYGTKSNRMWTGKKKSHRVADYFNFSSVDTKTELLHTIPSTYQGGSITGRGAAFSSYSAKPHAPIIMSEAHEPVPVLPEVALQKLGDGEFAGLVNAEIAEHDRIFGGEAVAGRRRELLKAADIDIEFEPVPEVKFEPALHDKLPPVAARKGFASMEPGSDPDFDFDSIFGSIDFSGPHEKYKIQAPSAPAPRFRIETNPDYVEHKRYFSSPNFAKRIPGFEAKLADSGLSSHSYIKIIRDQAHDLAGLFEEHDTEEDLIKALYASSDAEARQLNFRHGIALTKEQVEALRRDIIWHEPIIKDGKIYNAPRLYLAKGREKKSGLFASDTISLDVDNFENTQEISARHVKIASSGGLSNIGGRIKGSETVRISTPGLLHNYGGSISGGSADIMAGSILSESVASRSELGNSHNSWIAQRASMAFAREARIRSAGDQLYRGADLRAGSLDIEAGGSVGFDSIMLDSHFTRIAGVNYESSSSFWHAGSKLEVAGSLDIKASGDVALYASSIKAGGDISLQAAGDINLASGVNVSQYEARSETSKRNSLGVRSSKVTQSYNIHESLAGGDVASGGSLNLSAARVVELSGVKFKSGRGVQIEAAEAHITGKATTNINSSNSEYRDAMIMASSHNSSGVISHNPTSFEGGVDLSGAGRVSAEIDATKPGGYALAKSVQEAGGDLSYVKDTRIRESSRMAMLTPEASMVVGGALSFATAGIGGGAATAMMGATSATGSTALGAAIHTGLHGSISSMVTTSINSTVIGVINSGGDLGKGLGQAFSTKGIASIGRTALTSGLTSGFEAGLDIKGANPGMAKGEYYMNLAKQSAIRSSVSGLVNGSGLNDIGHATALSFGLGAAQNMVGDIGQASDESSRTGSGIFQGSRNVFGDGSLGKAALHGLVGATYADLSGGNAGVGFISGAASEFAAPYLSEDLAGMNQAAFAGSITALTAGGSARDMMIASSIGASNIENNQGMHKAERIAVYKNALEAAESEEERKAVTLAAMQKLHAADGMPEGSTKEATKRYLESGKAEKGYALLGESEKKLGLEGVMKYSARDRFEDLASSKDEYLVRGAGGVLAGISFVDAAIGARLARADPMLGYSMIAGGAYGAAIGGEAAFGRYDPSRVTGPTIRSYNVGDALNGKSVPGYFESRSDDAIRVGADVLVAHTIAGATFKGLKAMDGLMEGTVRVMPKVTSLETTTISKAELSKAAETLADGASVRAANGVKKKQKS